MTENTPTPAELRTLAIDLPDLTQEQIDEAGDSFGSAYDQIAGPGETYTADVMAMKLYELGWLPPRQAHELRAERDALAAAAEQAKQIARSASVPVGVSEANHLGALLSAVHRELSVNPADALAARDARVLDRIINHLRSTVRLGLGLTKEQKQDRRNIIEWLEADRIEREAQR